MVQHLIDDLPVHVARVLTRRIYKCRIDQIRHGGHLPRRDKIRWKAIPPALLRKGAPRLQEPVRQRVHLAPVVPPLTQWIRQRKSWLMLRAEPATRSPRDSRSEEHTSELQSRRDLVCRLLLEKKKTTQTIKPYLRR